MADGAEDNFPLRKPSPFYGIAHGTFNNGKRIPDGFGGKPAAVRPPMRGQGVRKKINALRAELF